MQWFDANTAVLQSAGSGLADEQEVQEVVLRELAGRGTAIRAADVHARARWSHIIAGAAAEGRPRVRPRRWPERVGQVAPRQPLQGLPLLGVRDRDVRPRICLHRSEAQPDVDPVVDGLPPQVPRAIHFEHHPAVELLAVGVHEHQLVEVIRRELERCGGGLQPGRGPGVLRLQAVVGLERVLWRDDHELFALTHKPEDLHRTTTGWQLQAQQASSMAALGNAQLLLKQCCEWPQHVPRLACLGNPPKLSGLEASATSAHRPACIATSWPSTGCAARPAPPPSTACACPWLGCVRSLSTPRSTGCRLWDQGASGHP